MEVHKFLYLSNCLASDEQLNALYENYCTRLEPRGKATQTINETNYAEMLKEVAHLEIDLKQSNASKYFPNFLEFFEWEAKDVGWKKTVYF